MVSVQLTDSQLDQLNQILAATGMKPEVPKPEGPKMRCKVLVSPRQDYPGFGAAGHYWLCGDTEAELTQEQIDELRAEPARRFLMVFVHGQDSEPSSVAQVAAERDAATAEVARLKEQLQAMAEKAEAAKGRGERRG